MSKVIQAFGLVIKEKGGLHTVFPFAQSVTWAVVRIIAKSFQFEPSLFKFAGWGGPSLRIKANKGRLTAKDFKVELP